MARNKGRQDHPKGGKISVGTDERQKFKKARIAHGWTQPDLALKSGVNQATISNLETGRHPQVAKEAYARIYYALFKSEPATEDDATFRAIVAGAANLDETRQKAVAQLIESLATTSALK